MRTVERGGETGIVYRYSYLYLSGKLNCGHWIETNIEHKNVEVHIKVNSRVH